MTDMVVDPVVAMDAAREVAELGSRAALVSLSKVEPALAKHIESEMDRIWAQLESYGVIDSGQIDQALYPIVLGVVVSSVQALRHGTYLLWEGTCLGAILDRLDPELRLLIRKDGTVRTRPARGSRNCGCGGDGGDKHQAPNEKADGPGGQQK